ncbi:MAG: hypothetical protein MUC65_03165 [Pontiellaceae bacterium]|jgi:hypothetical protein|nr:hypothetical protein [Pontiellaceae bacterium]
MLRILRNSFEAVLLTASLVSADVNVKFSNSTLPANTTNELGSLTLWFKVDGTGNVTMDASAASSQQIVRDAVDAWDGSVGTVSCPAAFNTTFLLELNGAGGSGFRLTNHDGGGLGVAGQSAWRIDRPGFEFIDVMAVIPVGRINFRSVSWNYIALSFPVHMTLTAPLVSLTNRFISPAGTWNISDARLVIANNETLRFSNVFPGDIKSGYALAGFTFDIVESVDLSPITVGFVPNDGVSETEQFREESPQAQRVAGGRSVQKTQKIL